MMQAHRASIWLATVLLPVSTAGQQLDLQRVLDDARAEVKAPGGILGVRFPDDTTVVVVSGLADIALGRHIEQSDAFFLGSVSKTYTAVVALRLIEDGKLALDDPLSRFLPSFPRGREITVRHLLGHTSGLKDFYSYLYFRPDRLEMIEFVTKDWTQAELLDLSGRFGHWFAPGEDWTYSSTNYFLLGVLIERVTGTSLSAAYETFIFRPRGLQRTWLTWHEPPRAPLPITGYMGRTDAWEHSAMFGELGPTTALDRSPVEWGAGGLAGPAADALEFMDALMNGLLLMPQSLDSMQTFRTTPSLGVGGTTADLASGYGLGLVRMERAGYTVVGHGGLFTGHTAGLWHLPSCGVTIVLFFNRGFVGQRRILDRVVPAIARLRPDLDCTN